MEKNTNFYRYKINSLDILISGEDPVTITQDRIMGIKMEKDFDSDFFPILMMELFLDYPVYYNIVKNKSTVKFKIKMEKYLYDEYEDDEFMDNVFEELFSIYINDDTYFIDEGLYEQSLEIAGKTMQGMLVEFYFFKDSSIGSSRKIFNRVVTSTNMSDAIAFLLSKAGYTNVLMSPLENSSSYNQVVLLPTTVIQNLIYLEKQYGFYKRGANIFFDYDTTYVLNKTSNATAYRTGEYTNVLMLCYKTSGSDSITPGTYTDDEKKIYNVHVNKNNITINTTAQVDDQVHGTKVSVVDTSKNSSSTVSPNIEVRNNNEKVLINNFSNKYIASMIENDKIENDNIIYVNLYDFNTDIFTPNKKYTFSFEDKEVQSLHGGNYRLSYCSFIFTKSGDEFTVTGSFTFKKPK